MKLAESIPESIGKCADVPTVAGRLGSTRPPQLGNFALTDLSPAIRRAVEPLTPGQVSAPIKLGDGILVLILCGRTQPSTQIPDAPQVRNLLLRRRMALMSRRYLRDIRLAAVVDLRV